MENPTYLFDFKNITKPEKLQEFLKNWKIEKISDRCFQVGGRNYTKEDLMGFYQCLGRDGHFFIYDYRDKSEFFYQKSPKGRKRDVAKDSDLDTQTLHLIQEHQDNQSD